MHIVVWKSSEVAVVSSHLLFRRGFTIELFSGALKFADMAQHLEIHLHKQVNFTCQKSVLMCLMTFLRVEATGKK